MTNINLFRNRPVAVIGAGVMGVGIVQVALLAGHPVHLFDVREGAAAAAAGQLARHAGQARRQGQADARGRGRRRAAGSTWPRRWPSCATRRW